jgi:integrase
MPLTAIQIKNAKQGKKTQRMYDSHGLYLEVAPTGGKWWRQKFRFERREKRISLGVWPHVSLKDARRRRDENRSLLAEGIDPSAQRKAAKVAQAATDSLEVVAREWFYRQKNIWVPNHAVTILSRLENNIFPWLGEQSIGAITAQGLLEILRRIEKRGAHETAHRVLGVCDQIWRYAIATGRVERNIAADLKGALTPAEKTHLAAVTAPKEVRLLMRSLDGYEGTLIVQCALRLAPLLFVRPGELRKAEWKDIDFDKKEWGLIASKIKTPHIVPLSRQAIEILQTLHPLTGSGRYVFPGARSKDRPMSDNAVLAALRRMEIGKDEMCGHGFRAMARTILDEELKFRPEYIEQQLSHVVKDPLGRAYNRTTHLPERHEMMQKWSDYLDTLKAS